MNALSYLKRAASYADLNAKDFPEHARIGLVTNFTDDLLKKIVIGLALENNIYPFVFAEPYKRYHFDLQNSKSELYATDSDITFFVFDVSSYAEAEFSSSGEQVDELLRGMRAYAQSAEGHIVIATLPLPGWSAYGPLRSENPLFKNVAAFNAGVAKLAEDMPNVSAYDLSRLMQEWGERHARDLRSLYAFDVPFTNEFTLALSRELMSYLLALRGKARKCIVVDLDNTLWGGIVGEVGAHGIELGPGYPGLAYQNFQRALLSYWQRGIILAIVSKNNAADVEEVFAQNQNMVLKKAHFGSIRANWERKSSNLVEVARELNIGLDAMVFLDDDAANREEVRAMLPQVFVPDMPANPEEYARALFSLTCFNQLALTDEDKKKGSMYAQERERREVVSSGDPEEYLLKLGVEIAVSESGTRHVARVAQMTQKTNQFNTTTKRYSEADLERMAKEGFRIFTADARDKFGHYGIVALAIIKPLSKTEAELDSLLMSCRAVGRGVEYALLDRILDTLAKDGYRSMVAPLVETPKNQPVRDFLPSLGFVVSAEEPGKKMFRLELSAYASNKPEHAARILDRVTISS